MVTFHRLRYWYLRQALSPAKPNRRDSEAKLLASKQVQLLFFLNRPPFFFVPLYPLDFIIDVLLTFSQSFTLVRTVQLTRCQPSFATVFFLFLLNRHPFFLSHYILLTSSLTYDQPSCRVSRWFSKDSLQGAYRAVPFPYLPNVSLRRLAF